MLAIVLGRDETFAGIVMKLTTKHEAIGDGRRLRVLNEITNEFITWNEILIAMADRMKEEIPSDTYEKFYKSPRIFALYKSEELVIEIIDFTQEVDCLEIHIAPTSNLERSGQELCKFLYCHIRSQSLEDCKMTQKTKLAKLGFYRQNSNRNYLSCIHCNQSNITIGTPALGNTMEDIFHRHTKRHRNCHLAKHSINKNLEIFEEKKKERDDTLIHHIRINRNLIRLNNIHQIMMENAKIRDESLSTDSPTSNNHTCAICLEKPANILQIPCFHMVTCKDCFRKQDENHQPTDDDLNLGNHNQCIICRHPVSIATSLFL